MCRNSCIYLPSHYCALAVVSGQNSPSMFQCQFSSQPSGFLYTPNIPDSYFNDENYIMTNEVAGLINGIIYIFTLPSESVQRNCSGRVESIQYCYQARDSDIGQTREAFKLSIPCSRISPRGSAVHSEQ